MNINIELQKKITGLEQKLEIKSADLSDLAMMGSVVTSIHEMKQLLSVVLEMSIRLVDAEVGMIMLEENGRLKTKISWGISDEIIYGIKTGDGQPLPEYVFENRKPVLLNDPVGPENQQTLINSLIILPIQNSEKCLGLIALFNKSSEPFFSSDDLDKMDSFLNLVAVGIENVNLLGEKLKQQKIEQEMLIAKQVQETILPQDIGENKNIEIGAVYYPANEVGGDFYDIINLSESKFAVILGDVSNKGVPAALIMSAAAGIIKTELASNPDLNISELAKRTNNILANGIIKDREMFVTLFFSLFDLKSKKLTYSNAGHLPGLLMNSKTGQLTDLQLGGPIIGQFPGIEFKEGEHDLAEGDRLFLFTDGLSEAADKNGELFGLERIREMFKAEKDLPPQQYCRQVKQWIDRFTVGCAEDMIDDFTIMQLKVK